MEEFAADPASEDRANADRKERKAHVGALLLGWRESRDVLVITWRLDDLAEGDANKSKNDHWHGGVRHKQEPREPGDQGADRYGAHRRNFLCRQIYENRKANHHDRTGGQEQF